MSRAWALLMMITVGCAPRTDPHIPSAMTVVKTDWSPVTTFLDSAVAGGAAPGAVVGVSVAGQRFLYATGRLTRGETAPVEATTVYDLASLTKVIGLTTAVMLAVDDRKLLPLFRETATREEAFALADITPLSSPPGTTDVYSDLGMIVLTQVVEAVYHERLDSLLARRIYQPLGMTSVRFLPTGDPAQIGRAHV